MVNFSFTCKLKCNNYADLKADVENRSDEETEDTNPSDGGAIFVAVFTFLQKVGKL